MFNKKIYKKLFFILIIFIPIYISITKPYIRKIKIKNKIKKRYNININLKDKLITAKESKTEWYGEKQSFTLLESKNQDTLNSYFNNIELNKNELKFISIKRIIEIENILNIEKENRINFNDNYNYQIIKKRKRALSSSSEQYNNYLYIITVREGNKYKIFLIEDLSVLDLERSHL